ncbi:MAG: PAS domain S-box protein [Desulfobacter sp.]|nr:MAG: PAS domain S-box protein [Desulfobacter sp.]
MTKQVSTTENNPSDFARYLSAARVVIVAIDDKGLISYINPYGLDILGYSEEELMGKNWFETCLPKADIEDGLKGYHQLMAGTIAPAEYYESRVITKSGEERAIEWRNAILRDSNGRITGSLSSGSDIPPLKKSQARLGQVRDISKYKRSEKILAQSESRFRDISMSMADWIWEMDHLGRYTFTAGNLKQVLGYDDEEVLGKTPFDFMPADRVRDVRDAFARIMDKKAPIVDLKNWNLRKDGTRVCLLTNGVPVLDASGNLLGYRGVDKDITRTLEIEDKLKKALETTEKIIENIPIGMMIVDDKKVIRRVNKAALAMTGFGEKSDLVGHICHDSICPAQRGKCPITDLRQKVDQSEKEVIRRDGEKIPVYKTALSIELEDEKVIIEAFMDISRLKAAEAALHESEDSRHTVMETIVDPLVVYDVNGRVTYLNPGFTRVFGWTLAELKGQKIDFVPPEDRPDTIEAVKRVLNGEKVSGFETRRYTKDHTIIDVRIGAGLLLSAKGRPMGMVTNFQDITREKKSRHELNMINRELEKAIATANQMALQAEIANMAKSEFLANMSHEIRTPLNGVIGMTGLLLDTGLTREQRHYAGNIQSCGESLLSIISDVLDFSKIEAGMLEIETIDFDLRVLLDDVGTMMSHRVQEKDLEFICAAAPEVPALLQGDPARLRQILVNLVGNAVKFTQKGEISVLAHLEKETETQVELLFSVKDTGIGISPEKHLMLFDSFTQADSSTTREFGGTGLGLSISKKLCEMMGGKIGVKSQEGDGAEFWFTVCFKKQDEAFSGLKRRTLADLKGTHILIVDDNKTNREILQGQLASWGCRVSEAAGGPEALHLLHGALADGDPFKIAILDMQMPVMDGLSLGKIIKSDDKTKSLQLIMMTSMGQAGDAKRFEAVGFSAYLIKPVGFSELYSCLSAILAGPFNTGKKQSIVTRHTVPSLYRKNTRILIAEDNEVNRQVAIGILKKLDLTNVDTAVNGVKAVEAFKAGRYDLVLMDVQMPEMDGLSATRAIREFEETDQRRRTPVIAMTAHAMKKDKDRCLLAGMDDYISKPVTADVMVTAFERWLPETGDIVSKGQPDVEEKNGEKPEHCDLPVFCMDELSDRLMGDPDLVKTVIDSFLADMPRQISRLEELIQQQAVEEAGNQGHQIKGAAGNLSAMALSDIGARIEEAGKKGDLDRIQSILPMLDRAFSILKKELEHLFI